MSKPLEPCSTKSLCLYDSTFAMLPEIQKRHSREIAKFGRPDGLSSTVAFLIHHQAVSDAKGEAKKNKHSSRAGQDPPPPFEDPPY